MRTAPGCRRSDGWLGLQFLHFVCMYMNPFGPSPHYTSGENFFPKVQYISGENTLPQTHNINGENVLPKTQYISGENALPQTHYISGENVLPKTQYIQFLIVKPSATFTYINAVHCNELQQSSVVQRLWYWRFKPRSAGSSLTSGNHLLFSSFFHQNDGLKKWELRADNKYK